jgi:hypothetical protein
MALTHLDETITAWDGKNMSYSRLMSKKRTQKTLSFLFKIEEVDVRLSKLVRRVGPGAQDLLFLDFAVVSAEEKLGEKKVILEGYKNAAERQSCQFERNTVVYSNKYSPSKSINLPYGVGGQFHLGARRSSRGLTAIL